MKVVGEDKIYFKVYNLKFQEPQLETEGFGEIILNGFFADWKTLYTQQSQFILEYTKN